MDTPHSNTTTPDTMTSSTVNTTATNTTTQESRISIRNADGYTGLLEYSQYTSALPRGLIFIDPPYQYGSDTERIVDVIQRLKYHWRSARLVIWFPTSHAFHATKTARLLALVQEALARAGPPHEKNYNKNTKQKNNTNKKTKHKIDGLCIELYPNYHTTDSSSSKSNSTTTQQQQQQQQQHKVIGTGMIFINPPYGLETDLQVLLPDLGTLLFDDNKDEGSSGGGDGGQHRRVENDHDDGNNADEDSRFNQDDSADNDGAHTRTHSRRKNEKYTLKIQRF